MRLKPPIMSLAKAIAALDSTVSIFQGSGTNKIPDVVLFNYVIDVQEQSRAVQAVVQAGVPRAAFVNARAAMESALDASYLVADPAEYRARGARARVVEMFEQERLSRRADLEKTVLPGASEAMEAAIKSDAALWEQDSRGARALLLSTFEHFCKHPPGIGDHWSGLNRIELYRSLAGTKEEKDEMAKMLDVVYGHLSLHAHPKPRTSQRVASLDPDGTLVIAGRENDEEHAVNATVLAIQLMIAAVERRKAMTQEVA